LRPLYEKVSGHNWIMWQPIPITLLLVAPEFMIPGNSLATVICFGQENRLAQA
jgi:hypothetical protein